MIWISDGSQVLSYDAADYLAGLGATGLDGWTLGAVTAVSADGTLITGWGTDSQGRIGGWGAVIPAPGSVALMALGGLGITRRRRA